MTDSHTPGPTAHNLKELLDAARAEAERWKERAEKAEALAAMRLAGYNDLDPLVHRMRGSGKVGENGTAGIPRLQNTFRRMVGLPNYQESLAMPIVHHIPPASFWHGRRFRACPFDIDILRAWAKRTARAGHTWWLYRGRLVSPHAIAAFGVQEAWELAGPATIEIDTTVTPWTVGPRA